MDLRSSMMISGLNLMREVTNIFITRLMVGIVGKIGGNV
jgi:hypothetical protein